MASQQMPSPETPFEAAMSDLVVANRILAAEGVLDGFGHVSIRDPRDPACYLMSRSLAPALVTAADIVQHGLDNQPTTPTSQSLYYERWIHGEIYQARPEVNAIVHSHSPTVVPFASTRAPLRPILHNASFLGFGTPVFEIRNFIPDSDLMISTAALGKALAQALGPTADVVLLRGHGNVVVGPSIQITVFRAYYTEINARQQLNAMILGPNDVVYMNAGECETTDKVMQAVAGRPWDLWKRRVRREMRRAEAEDRL
jgi:ribulose-5-phosphate 4-epimerase/fuculose-1-phosphate aldolase